MTVQFVSQTRVVDQAQLSALEKTAGSELWEGIVLRKDVPYLGQRVYVCLVLFQNKSLLFALYCYYTLVI